MILLELSKQNIDLSTEEALTLSLQTGRLYDNYLLVDKEFAYERLAYTKRVFEVFFSCDENDLKETVREFNFGIHGSFAVYKAGNLDLDVKDLADLVWKRVKNQVVDLKNPKNKIFFVFANKVFCCKLLWENKEDFEARKTHNRPEAHPTSLHPKLARALVNLSGSDDILDPFCGSGGILIEAGLMGLKVRGSDLDQIMLNKAMINFDYFGIKDYSLEKKDATKLNESVGAIVTDLPYGKNSKLDNMKKTYLEFLKNAEKITRKVVVVFPDFVDYKKIVEKAGWKIEQEFTYYLHKSMSKKILLLSTN